MSYIIAILVFGLLIFVHELGHFIVAKLSGITVYLAHLESAKLKVDLSVEFSYFFHIFQVFIFS